VAGYFPPVGGILEGQAQATRSEGRKVMGK